jgi:DNA-binding response OmpR family regulator
MASPKPPVVLIIEDDDSVARSLSRMLETDFELRRASSLHEGIALIDSGDYAALICDWDLGDGTGDVALARSAERFPKARRVLYTARLPEETPVGIADVILQKPTAREAIIAALTAVAPHAHPRCGAEVSTGQRCIRHQGHPGLHVWRSADGNREFEWG